MLEFAHSIRQRRRRTSLCKLASRLNLEWGSAVMLDAWHDAPCGLMLLKEMHLRGLGLQCTVDGQYCGPVAKASNFT